MKPVTGSPLKNILMPVAGLFSALNWFLLAHTSRILRFGLILTLVTGASVESRAGIGPEWYKDTSMAEINVDDEITFRDQVIYKADGTYSSGYAASNYVEYTPKSRVFIEINEQLDSCFLDTFSFSVKLILEYLDADQNSTVDTVVLTVNYDTALGIWNVETASYILENAYWVKVTIDSLSNESLKKYINLGYSIEPVRYKDLIQRDSIVSLNPIQFVDSTQEVKVSWLEYEGAEEYDLEWTWIDAFDTLGNLDSSLIDTVDFNNNATRVTIKSREYSISTVYERGYLIFRLRAVGRNKIKPAQVTATYWSDYNHNGEFVNYNITNEKVEITYSSQYRPLDDSLNWQYSAAFAEEGKRKEVISYYDGSSRNRQSVTRISTGMVSVVGETVYDYEGRPAVNILPAPAFDHLLRFHPEFNLSTSTEESYSKKDFDDSTGICAADVTGLDTSSGASKYYSPNNPDIGVHRYAGYIPDAQLYPMAVTEFMPDGTGRVKRQSGVGPDHQLGTDHETKYYYATPSQKELDRLFGNDVGYYMHYQKEMVLDPNGQASVSYKDLSGKVIATALAGDSPERVHAIQTEQSADVTLDAQFTSYIIDGSQGIKVSKSIPVSTDNTLYEFAYEIQIPRLTFDSLENMCFDCVYELVFSLEDECGYEVLDGDPVQAGNQPIIRTIGKVGQDFDVNCEGNGLTYNFYLDSVLNDSFISVYLDQGQYTLTKTIRISDAAYQYYLKEYLNSSEAKSLSDFEAEYYQKLDTAACEITCDSCFNNLGTYAAYQASRQTELSNQGFSPEDITEITTNEYDALFAQCKSTCFDSSAMTVCEGMYYNLLFDLMPGQQYANYLQTDGGLLEVEGLLDVNNTELDFNYKQYFNGSTWVNIDYRDEINNPIKVNINGELISPNNLSPEQYIKYATLEWMENLVQFHPEYCRYQFCLDNQDAIAYDDQMRSIQSFNQAYREGYLDPLDTFDIPDNEDPFWQSGAHSAYKADFYTNYFDGYEVLHFPLMSIPCSKISILEYALLVHYSDWDLSNCAAANNWLSDFIQDDTSLLIDTTVICWDRADAVWNMFRALYLSQKGYYLDSLAKLTCNPAIPEGYTTRLYSYSDIYSTSEVEEDEDEQYYDDLGTNKVLEACDTFCENQANYWLAALGGCNLPQSIKDQLIPEFMAICKNGCGPDHPIGAKNYPTTIGKRYTTDYYSFEEAFEAIVPDSCKSKDGCSVWAIALPRSYRSDLSKNAALDTTCISGTLTGDTCYDDASFATRSYIKAKQTSEDSIGCEDCIDCNEFWVAWDSLSARYDGPFIDSTWTLKEVLTNFMNDYFGFNLTYWDYEEFAKECYSFGMTGAGTTASSGMYQNKYEPFYMDKLWAYKSEIDIPDYNWQPRTGEYLYASIAEYILPPQRDVTYFTGSILTTDKYLDTCVCNQLQAYLEEFNDASAHHEDEYDDIMGGNPSQAAIDSFQAWMDSEYSGCLEATPGVTTSFVEGLLKCRDFYSQHTGGDLSTGHWTTILANELDNLLANDQNAIDAQHADCITTCDGDHPSERNPWWNGTSSPDWFDWNDEDPRPAPCGTCPDCEELEAVIDTVLQAYSGYGPGEEFNIYKDCFLSSICQLRDPFNNNLCSNCDAEGVIIGTTTDSLNEIYDVIWEAFESKYLTIWEQYSMIPAFGKIEVNGELVMPEDTLDSYQKIDLLMQEYGNCIDIGCSYCYPGGEAICCKDTTVYFRELLNFLNGFTETKHSYGNQFSSPSPYSVYPQLEEYYASPYYDGTCYSSIKYRIIDNKMPTLHFVLEDDCGDQFSMVLSYVQNYNNQANYGRIVEFLDVQTLPAQSYEGCFGTNRFIVRARQEISGGGYQDVEIVGMISEYYLFTGKWVEDSCDEQGPILCNKVLFSQSITVPDPCTTWKKMRARTYAKLAYDNYLDSLKNSFRIQYYNTCINAQDTVQMLYDLKEYHYTLYYYDQAGNLVQTVPPEGVDLLTSYSEFNQVADHRNGQGSALYPSHTLITQYNYNSLNEVRWQSTPDGGESNFFYDRLGRIVVSQNAKQAAQSIGQYSYTLYDSLGRIREVGQIASVTAMSTSIAADTSDLNDWIRNNVKEQITRTWYDNAKYALNGAEFNQVNLRNRVVSMTFHSSDDTLYDHGIHYSYDIHGNVSSMIREITALHDILQGYKKMEYDYDLVSGNVNYVYYQKDQDDQYTHRYYYDADNRITSVQTSNDGYHWDEDAKYFYHKHGPLRRMRLGHLDVQGVDYAYTLQGWLKGVNSTTLDASRDIGQDGHSSGDNQTVAKDVFGFSLHYYSTDYTPINGQNTSSPSSYFLLNESGSGFAQRVPDLYNGNISRMVTALAKLETTTIGKAYEYDQLNRISKAMTYDNYSSASNSWLSDTTANSDHYSAYTYDANGNITSLTRYAEDARIMDQLNYHYTSGTNQLEYVDDQVHKDSFDYDIDDQSGGNYAYDQIGNLIADSSEYIMEITWTAYGKIKEIIRDTNRVHGKPDLQFEYSPDGHRVAKHVTDTSGTTVSTWYIRDASGNIMATYSRDYSMVIDTNKISIAEIYSKLQSDKTLQARLTYLHEDLNWSTHIDSLLLDESLTDVDNANVEDDLLYNFDPETFVTSAIFDSIYAHISDTQLISAMRYDGYADGYLFDALCDQCIDSLMTHVFKYDYQGSLEWLQSNDPVRFNVLKDLYAQDPPPPDPPLSPPQQVTAIMNNSTEANSVYQIGQSAFGHDCNMYKNMYDQVVGFNTNDSRDLMDGMPNFKTCLASDFTQSEILGALIAYLGYEQIWNWIFLYGPYDAGDYVHDLRDSVPDQYLYYATLEINTDQFMTKMVSFMGGNPSVTTWLNKIKSRFGNEYYNEMMNYLAEGNSSSYWSYFLGEHHIYGSARIGIEQRSLVLVEQNRYGLNYNYITENGDSVVLYDYSSDSIRYRLRGDKRYELSNHLGNVLAVITDRRIQSCGLGEVMFYSAQVVSISDYYPFGMEVNERTFAGIFYRFGFNGMEQNPKVSDDYSTYFRMYNCKLGRWYSMDPKAINNPWNSPYLSMSNNPINRIDPNGDLDNPPSSDNDVSPFHIVSEGDYVWEIAKERLGDGATNTQIARLTNTIILANNLNENGDVDIGQVLIIPTLGIGQATSAYNTASNNNPSSQISTDVGGFTSNRSYEGGSTYYERTKETKYGSMAFSFWKHEAGFEISPIGNGYLNFSAYSNFSIAQLHLQSRSFGTESFNIQFENLTTFGTSVIGKGIFVGLNEGKAGFSFKLEGGGYAVSNDFTGNVALPNGVNLSFVHGVTGASLHGGIDFGVIYNENTGILSIHGLVHYGVFAGEKWGLDVDIDIYRFLIYSSMR